MSHLPVGVARSVLLMFLVVLLITNVSFSQVETATVSGQVSDPSGLNVSGAQVNLVDIDRDTTVNTKTNSSGLYTFASVRPGRYRMEVRSPGFKVVNVTGVTVNVQDHLEQNFKLTVGSISESVTVEGGAPLVDTESSAVSTVVDRQFAENLPLNGRSFQTLIQLTPGVVLTATNTNDTGQFSVNGQRAVSNYWMVDGVGANVGTGGFIPGNGFGGALGSFSAQGGTNSLVSVDAMQEFRIQTSTYAPEFGRTPGGQISIVTRSGTNQFHGTIFEYLRNDALDANDWFANNKGLPKPEERQNDFGGTFSGPILKDRTFFFFSYEGLRLRLPQVKETLVPDVAARQNAIPSLQPYLNAYPIPNGPDEPTTGVAQFNGSFSNRSTLDAYSLRVDHTLRGNLTVFGRYNYSPSQVVERGFSFTSLSTVSPNTVTTQTATVGATWTASPLVVNDLRFNYSRVNSGSFFTEDSFGGAVPLTSLPFPSSVTTESPQLFFGVISLMSGSGSNWSLNVGKNGHNLQRQINVVDNISVQRGSHSLKFGVDFRRLSPLFDGTNYEQQPLYLDVPSVESGALLQAGVFSGRSATLLFRNLGVFAQDTWKITPRITLTYGLRWDLDFAPSTLSGPNFPAVTGFNLTDLSNVSLAPAGTPPYRMSDANLAPRVGIAYQFDQSHTWETVFRGGFGVFYDLASSEAGNAVATFTYPFGATNTILGSVEGGTGTFPLSSSEAVPPEITSATTSSSGLYGFDPKLRLPYTLEWNVSLQQALGRQQTITASYVGSAGRRLLQSAEVNSPNPNFAFIAFVTNASTSGYDALQLQFQRQLARGLQTLVSYTWSHSIDTASAGSIGTSSNAFVPSAITQSNRGPSDFDIRNAFSAAVTYQLPTPHVNALAKAVLGGWSVQNVVQARSASPVTVDSDSYNGSFTQYINGYFTLPRPDVVPGQPFYLYGPQYPGGKAFNPVAFQSPPVENGNVQQGNLGRNALRGFGAAQWDFAIHREFPIHESIRLQFRAEMFNVLNHPNFGPPDGLLSDPTFGLSTQTLGQSLAGGYAGSGSFSSLYQIGGPRSIQFALKMQF